MDDKRRAWNEMSKAEYELSDKLNALNKAKNNYKDALVTETANDLKKVLEEEGNLTDRDFHLFLNSLANDLKNLYSNRNSI